MMESGESELARVMASVYERTKAFLRDEMDISVREIMPGGGNINALALREITVIVGLTGPISLLVSLSFSAELIKALFERFTADIDVPADEHDLYITETASEIVNTVLGHCTSDLVKAGQKINMTPPVIVDHGKKIRRDNRAQFASINMLTECGMLDVNFVGSRKLFDTQLLQTR